LFNRTLDEESNEIPLIHCYEVETRLLLRRVSHFRAPTLGAGLDVGLIELPAVGRPRDPFVQLRRVVKPGELNAELDIEPAWRLREPTVRPMARPCARARMVDHAGAHRIVVDISDQSRDATFANPPRLGPAGKHGADSLAAPIDQLREQCVGRSEHRRERHAARHHSEMNMVAHDGICETSPVRFGDLRTE